MRAEGWEIGIFGNFLPLLGKNLYCSTGHCFWDLGLGRDMDFVKEYTALVAACAEGQSSVNNNFIEASNMQHWV